MELAALALGWLAYAALHSLLAAQTVKAWVARRWPTFARGYRLAYNLLALILLLPLVLASYRLPGEWLWRWTGAWAWLANGLALAALAGFLLSTRWYDMKEFLGLRQLSEPADEELERGGLTLSPFHRWVRHPWYGFALVILWTRDMNAPLLLSTLAITLYFIVGARLEEKKLVARFGAAYREYQMRVPALLPWPGKRLTASEACALMQRARHGQHEF
ncbi:MAG: hypothetical protein N3C63_04915 [Rhodocyclaceae bacterium]|nr:hypothetical protein [Rhodocyclaceae bacterium]